MSSRAVWHLHTSVSCINVHAVMFSVKKKNNPTPQSGFVKLLEFSVISKKA